MAGRPESPLEPSAGPLQRCAGEFRKLREEAGSATYRSMAQRAGQGASTLSQAAAGDRLPTLPVVLANIRACGGDAEKWEARWREVGTEAATEPRAQDEDAEPPYRGWPASNPSTRTCPSAVTNSLIVCLSWPAPGSSPQCTDADCVRPRRGVTGRSLSVRVVGSIRTGCWIG